MLRATPSAGATYPLEVFVFVGGHCVARGEEPQTQDYMEAGIYRYEVDVHALSLHKKGDLRLDLANAALNQDFIAVAPVTITICAIYRRTSSRYGERGARYIHMEVGHVGENIHLQAAALGLATVEVGAFRDHAVAAILGAEEHIEPLYIMPIGKPL
jgi:SagB-type dehydrogenase family enzyme